MCLEQRPEARHLGGVTERDGMRVADVDRRELDAVHDLPGADDDVAHVGLIGPVTERAHGDGTQADAHADVLRSRACHQPRACDARAVARHLGCRAVRVPDHDLDLARIRVQHLQYPVGAARLLAHALGREVRLLRDEVDVPVCVPA